MPGSPWSDVFAVAWESLRPDLSVTFAGCQTSVAGQQCGIERLGKGDVNSIIGGKVVPQLPDAGQKQVVWVSVQPQVREVSKRHVIAFAVDVAVCRITA
jgi:hypothetical protein